MLYENDRLNQLWATSANDSRKIHIRYQFKSMNNIIKRTQWNARLIESEIVIRKKQADKHLGNRSMWLKLSRTIDIFECILAC